MWRLCVCYTESISRNSLFCAVFDRFVFTPNARNVLETVKREITVSVGIEVVVLDM